MPYEPSLELTDSPAFQALSPELRDAFWSVVESCHHKDSDGALRFANPEKIQQRARLRRLTHLRLWWSLTGLALDGFIIAEDSEVRPSLNECFLLGIPARRLKRIPSKVAEEHGPSVSEHVNHVIMQACKTMQLGGEPEVAYAYLMGVLGSCDRADDVGDLERLRRSGF